MLVVNVQREGRRHLPTHSRSPFSLSSNPVKPTWFLTRKRTDVNKNLIMKTKRKKEKKLRAMHVPRYKRIKRKNTLFLSVMPNLSTSIIE
jgi:hypothetical protein